MLEYFRKITQWLNTNEGFTSALLAVSSLVIAVIAIIVSICTAKKQNKIALLNNRMRFFDDLQLLLTQELISWEFDIAKVSLFHHYSDTYINVIFNKDVSEFYILVKKSCEDVHKLWGDYDYAERNGVCNGKSSCEIEKEIQSICKNLNDNFLNVKTKWVEKFLKL